MIKTLKIAGVSLLAILVLGAAAFVGIQFVSAQQQTATPAAPAQAPVAPQTTTVPQAATEKGLVVVEVTAGSPADKAGLKRGDILLKINDTELNTGADLKTALSAIKTGDAVVLSVTHGDESRVLTATAGDQNGTPYLGFTTWGGSHGLRGFGSGGNKTFTLLPGALINSVVAGSPAEKAGLKQGDVILAVNGKDLSATYGLAEAIGSFKPGDGVTLKVQSGANTSDLQVTLGENPQSAGKAYLGVEYSDNVQNNGSQPQGQAPFFFHGGPFGGQGGTPHTVPSGMNGVAIMQVTPGSPAEKAGLKVNDVILAVDGKAVNTAQDIIDIVASHKVGDAITLTLENINSNSTNDVRVVLGENPQAAGKATLGVQIVSLNQLHQNVNPGQPAPVLPNNNGNTNG